MRPLQMRGDLRQRHVGRLLYQRQDLIGLRLNPVRAIVATLRPRLNTARPTPPLDPSDRRRRRNTKPLCRRTPRHPIVHRGNHTMP